MSQAYQAAAAALTVAARTAPATSRADGRRRPRSRPRVEVMPGEQACVPACAGVKDCRFRVSFKAYLQNEARTPLGVRIRRWADGRPRAGAPRRSATELPLADGRVLPDTRLLRR